MRLNRRLNQRHLIGLLLGLSAISCLAAPKAQRLRQLLAPVLSPLGQPSMSLFGHFRQNLSELGGGVADQARVQALQAENQALVNQTLSYERTIAQQGRSISDLQGWRTALSDFPCLLIPATVIAQDAIPYHAAALLRAGKAGPGMYVTTRGLAVDRPTAIPKNLAILSSTALVGRVVWSAAWTAGMQTLQDKGFQIEALVKRRVDPARPRLIEADDVVVGRKVHSRRPLRDDDPLVPVNLYGQGAGPLTTSEVPAEHGIAEGDWVVTSGKDTMLPVGVSVGVVWRVLPAGRSPSHVRLEVAPAASLEGLREVYVVMPQSAGVP